MDDVVLEFDHVWKKFKKGEKHNSLRDFIPSMTKRVFKGSQKEELLDKEFWSIKDVSFQVKRGEALGIIGPNGAGKSTILKLLSRILKPNKGDIKVNGRLSALIEVGAGFHQDLTGRENIYLNGAILGMKKNEIDKKFDEIVEFSGLEDFIDTPVKRYSSGMYTRLGFSVAAHVDPEILLVDEVLSVGDAGFQAKSLLKMREVISSGTTLIFVSHNVRQVARLCDKVIVLAHGEIKHIGDPNHAIKTYRDFVSRISGNKSKSILSNDMAFTVTPINCSGSKISSIPFGSPIKLMIECNLPLGFPESHLIIKIGSHDGQDYIGLSSEIGNIVIKPGVRRLTCQFNCNLLPNNYRMRLFLTDISTGRVLDEFGQPDLIINIQNDEIAKKLPSSEYAIIDVPVSWDIIKEE
ncbi:MAG: hypothetical protein A3C43_00995 [Candidatus Schekmanbacteria bacterium RIFCSPHIGHO2_02_FULL_38_11]|uniref:ABC transporter domain-containing protein n=1 Tax=Candidatus Schekmanbacteria bacterium RIFCSPLOWO2_12_FULL_38_15 TaxID=1817883 RepID=A0A1F7SN08_9BACT|nr:MAG: hypothetical protein A2043_08040 [Candidatus Schekmanbacteria bacterium GWA2_38_9]OGL50046.1 MAG: hypothetical protein A3C43_00995 [Candidatus Schekmanbacteria bacterium RIFCSPHIGHO2_02_FULL_38_11]OGL51163.1 MAG: hypothetical protein A3H37_09070 [Candidatus Schekmanbacteria bacterium RIFCSPLOWO2_02_FULL_38_14]OGL55163.1 MAG: hypothetical protein A3G31_02895 [Candidatus Schekmanbacteria bacterium RIFCSPLOWO2_12_FULL_38_15]